MLCVFISPCTNYKLIIRTMMSGKSLQVVPAAYYCLSIITNQNVMDNTTKAKHKTFVSGLVDLSLDHTKGALQHKTALAKHMITHRFHSDLFWERYYEKCGDSKVVSVLDGKTDVRVLNELAVLHEFMLEYAGGVATVEVTSDMIPCNFEHQVQTNPDFFVRLKVAVTFGNVTFRNTYHDEKSGMDMFRHSTRGSIGLLTYDSANGDNVQMTRDPIIPEKLIAYNRKRIQGIREGLKTDGISNDSFGKVLADCDTRVKYFENIDVKSPLEIFNMHNGIQQELFDKIHRHPEYNRSISFIFTKHVDYSFPLDSKYEAFEVRFKALLGARMYDLDKTQDRKDIFKAMLVAYKTEVDPKIIEKIQHLHHGTGITLNVHFLQDIATLIKHGLL